MALSACLLALTACVPSNSLPLTTPTSLPPTAAPALPASTPLPTRPSYAPGELVDYTAQDGDTLPALAARFNTTMDEIFAANPIIPRDATTMPPGLPMKIPIYYRALWGSSFQPLPDHAFVNGPALIGFNTTAFVNARDGWLKTYRTYAGGEWRTGPQLVDYIATNFSVSPRLLLALLEYQGGALSQSKPPVSKYLLGYKKVYYESPYLQLVWAANTLNNGYYGWREGNLLEFELTDGTLTRPDPWQNAASVALQYYFSHIYAGQQFLSATGPDGLLRTYTELFGDPWAVQFELIPGSLKQPDLLLPFPPGRPWSYTGGPHTGWGTGLPFVAVDFAPPSEFSGCFKVEPEQFSVAMADGLVVRSSIDGLALDLDKDGDERTGWVIYYLHLAQEGRAPLGKELRAGDPIGYPSCQGGHVTGTHVHIARKYNGEWILADSPLAFNMEGWIAHSGSVAYQGTLTRGNATVTACECGDAGTAIKAGPP
ncbi:MAG: LysM peptidoglycan-binding domain-containing protein [Chloroflexi bacterium]|nr:LysM peptidoglycan-binding domain-containing protein [Chloroflexota bacterium]